jgi:hypothetical protein
MAAAKKRSANRKYFSKKICDSNYKPGVKRSLVNDINARKKKGKSRTKKKSHFLRKTVASHAQRWESIIGNVY